MTKLTTLLMLAALSAGAQTNGLSTNTSGARSALSATTNRSPSIVELSESLRSQCIRGRRHICGKILEVLTDGLVIESGYTNLLREPLTKSWLVPGTVTASLATNLIESSEPGAICVGRVFLTNLPRARGAKPARYDYVIIDGFPAGQYTYTSLGTITRTVRRFSANLNKAVDLNLAAALKNQAPAAPAK